MDLRLLFIRILFLFDLRLYEYGLPVWSGDIVADLSSLRIYANN